MTCPYSKSQVKNAGRRLRRVLTGEEVASHDDLVRALTILRAYRADHQRPLVTATMGLRSMVRTSGCADPQVSQRLKRLNTIIDKLTREPSMSLVTMQDIGGCRAVLADVGEVYRVQQRIRRNRRELRFVDYIEHPAESGYRGVHSIVSYNDRMIEVQLRTRAQHMWAVTVERLGGRIGEDLKSGRGPDEVLHLLAAISEAMAIEERGDSVPAQLSEKLSTLRNEADPWLT